MAELNPKIPSGRLTDKWLDYKSHINLVNPANKRKLDIIVVGTGLAGASAAASLGELGFNVKVFVIRIVLAVLTALLPREVLMLQKITRTMATASTGFLRHH